MLFDAAARGRYATDASIYQVMPIGVFVPADANPAVLARLHELGVITEGAGTPRSVAEFLRAEHARWSEITKEIGVLPVGVALAIVALNPDYIRPLWVERTGRFLIALAVSMQIAGGLVIRKIIRIKI